MVQLIRAQFFVYFILFGLIGCSRHPALSHYELAQKLWDKGKYKAAVSEYQKVLKKDPKGKLGIQALYQSAFTQFLYLNEYEQAAQEFAKYIKLSRSGESIWKAQVQLGEILFVHTKNYDQAIEIYSDLLKKDPTHKKAPFFLFRKAKSYFFQWDFEKAIQYFGDVEKWYPSSPWAEKASYEKGLSYFTSADELKLRDLKKVHERFRSAISQLETFMKDYPKSALIPHAQFLIGNSYEELEEKNQALEIYQKLLKNHPTPALIQVRIHRLNERIEKAAKELR
ncbi:MAG: hypothetical protein CL678_12605 [Bdellovibrionaceae bacterium]|nr:hypothetical protein [Pseudobdellovibrionaceae bacterium]|tara:strand:+ start:7626 stop:8471 length:846 start_codon:yes stop_codon:yes gene_type:complete